MQCCQHPQLRLVAAGKRIPNAKKVETGGCDAFFVTPAGLGALGIADGPSACQQDKSTTASDGYAHSFISHCAEALEQSTTTAPAAASNSPNTDATCSTSTAAVVPDLADVMAAARDSTQQAGTGSAALLLAALQPGAELQVANIGGCRMLLLRGGCIVGETDQQQLVHCAAEATGTPSHAAALPLKPDLKKAGEQAATLQQAERFIWAVQEGDLLIAGSDGLFDNLFKHDMLPLAQQALCGYTNAAQHPTTTTRSSSSARRFTVGSWNPAHAAAADVLDDAATTAATAGAEAEYMQAAVSHAAELLAAAAAKNAASRWARVPAALPDSHAVGGCLLPWLMCRGGKMDDITCVVALVTKHGAQPGSSSSVAAAKVTAAAAVEVVGGEAEALYHDCNEQQEGPIRCSSSAAFSMQSCQSQGDVTAAGDEALPACGTQPDGIVAPAAATIAKTAAAKETAHSDTAAAESPSESSVKSQWALPAMHVARQSNPNKLTSARSDASSTSSYSRPGSSASSRSTNMLLLAGAASSAAAGSSRPSSAAGSYSSASDRSSVPPIKITRHSATNDTMSSAGSGRLRMMPKSNGSTAGSVAGSTSGGYLWRAPKLGDSPTHVQREAANRSHKTPSRMLAANTAAAAAVGGASIGRVSSVGSMRADSVDAGSVQQLMRLHEPHSATAAAAAGAENEEATETLPAGKDSAGQQLYVGSRVAVITDFGVAAVGRVKLLPGQKVDRWMDDKVWPEHLGIGDIRVSRDMQPVAQQAKFWVKCEGHGLYGNHPGYTFWSKRQQLQEKRICVSIPTSSLKLIE